MYKKDDKLTTIIFHNKEKMKTGSISIKTKINKTNYNNNHIHT
jgi:predicted RNA binding protein YcfA (HicA-like mRNA interferase family)